MTLPIQKLAAVFLALTLLILHVALPCEAQTPTDPEHRVVRVGWFESGEESEGMANSRAYYYEYLQAIAQYTGWSYEYVEGTWDECLEMLKQGKVDLLGFVQKNEERMETYHFPSLPMAITNGYLVTDSDSALTDAEALDGIRVGIARGNAYNANFEQYCEENDISVQYQTENVKKHLTPFDPCVTMVVAGKRKPQKVRNYLDRWNLARMIPLV